MQAYEAPSESDTTAAYISIQGCGAMAANALAQAWKRPVRHNRAIQRDALWLVLTATSFAEQVADAPVKDAPDPVTHYEALAAIRTLPVLGPFTASERLQIRQSAASGDYFSFELEAAEGGIEAYEPELLSQWHSWLWVPGEPGTRGQQPNPEALVLAEACTRAARNVGAILVARFDADNA